MDMRFEGKGRWRGSLLARPAWAAVVAASMGAVVMAGTPASGPPQLPPLTVQAGQLAQHELDGCKYERPVKQGGGARAGHRAATQPVGGGHRRSIMPAPSSSPRARSLPAGLTHHCQNASKQLLVLCCSHTLRATVWSDCAAVIVYASAYRISETCCTQAEAWKPLRPNTELTQPEYVRCSLPCTRRAGSGEGPGGREGMSAECRWGGPAPRNRQGGAGKRISRPQAGEGRAGQGSGLSARQLRRARPPHSSAGRPAHVDGEAVGQQQRGEERDPGAQQDEDGARHPAGQRGSGACRSAGAAGHAATRPPAALPAMRYSAVRASCCGCQACRTRPPSHDRHRVGLQQGSRAGGGRGTQQRGGTAAWLAKRNPACCQRTPKCGARTSARTPEPITAGRAGQAGSQSWLRAQAGSATRRLVPVPPHRRTCRDDVGRGAEHGALPGPGQRGPGHHRARARERPRQRRPCRQRRCRLCPLIAAAAAGTRARPLLQLVLHHQALRAGEQEVRRASATEQPSKHQSRWRSGVRMPVCAASAPTSRREAPRTLPAASIGAGPGTGWAAAALGQLGGNRREAGQSGMLEGAGG